MKDEKEPVLMNFEEFKHQLQDCRYCQRFGIEPKPFVGKEKSEKSAKIVQVSQQPSKSASESSIPFSDASGRKLIDEWYKIPRKAFDNPKLFLHHWSGTLLWSRPKGSRSTTAGMFQKMVEARTIISRPIPLHYYWCAGGKFLFSK